VQVARYCSSDCITGCTAQQNPNSKSRHQKQDSTAREIQTIDRRQLAIAKLFQTWDDTTLRHRRQKGDPRRRQHCNEAPTRQRTRWTLKLTDSGGLATKSSSITTRFHVRFGADSGLSYESALESGSFLKTFLTTNQARGVREQGAGRPTSKACAPTVPEPGRSGSRLSSKETTVSRQTVIQTLRTFSCGWRASHFRALTPGLSLFGHQ
jgi:hypothetical protein